ncbi:MAG: DUF6882 domain-containing protein [Verrucomicrobiota bacterium]
MQLNIQSDDDYNRYLNGCLNKLVAKNNRLIEEFELGKFEAWDIDQEDGRLVFSDPQGRPGVEAAVCFIGTFSQITNTWLWAWGNRTVAPGMARDVATLKVVGQENGIPDFTEQKWPCDDKVAWAMAAAATEILGGKGVYAAHLDDSILFMMYKDVRKVE